MSVPTYSIDVLREGLQSLVEGPAPDEAHPLHDPAIWLVEASCCVFDDSGLAGVLASPVAVELLGRRLHDDLVDLVSALDDARCVIGEDFAGARARLTPAVHAVLADLEGSAPHPQD